MIDLWSQGPFMPNGKTQILHSPTSTCISSYPGPHTISAQDPDPTIYVAVTINWNHSTIPKTDTRLLIVSYIPTLPFNFNIFNTFHPQNFRQNHRNAIQSTASTFPHPPLALTFISLRKQSCQKKEKRESWMGLLWKDDEFIMRVCRALSLRILSQLTH